MFILRVWVLTTSVGLGISLFAFCAPRVFIILDTRAARNHLRASCTSAPPLVSVPVASDFDSALPTKVPATQQPPLLQIADMCNHVARQVRTGNPSGPALLSAVQTYCASFREWAAVASALADHTAVIDALNIGAAECNGLHREAMALMLATAVGNEFSPSGIERCAAILRSIHAHREDAKVAAAQSQLSIRILTWMPLLVGMLVILGTGRLAVVMHSPGVVAVTAIGLLLNWCGRVSSGHLVQRTMNSRSDHDELATVADHMSLAIRTGSDIALALRRAGAVSPVETRNCCNTASSLMIMGEPLNVSLAPLVTRFGASAVGLVEAMTSALTEGAPIATTVDRIAQDSREMRRRANETRLRQLPTRLTIPLVAFVLPSFLCLTIGPVVVSTLSGIHIPHKAAISTGATST